jgi:NAD(P)-dependent dehydrogenase (short-subunit alcohol dehydrogenase family)
MSTVAASRSVALVTGAAGAVGEAILDRLQVDGFLVAGLDRDRGAGDLALTVDATDRRAMIAAAERVTRELGPISVLVTSPSHYDAAPFGEMSRNRWRRLLVGHLGTTVNACAAVVPDMVRAGRGTVVTTSSWVALAGIAGEAYFAAATGSILAFTKSFSLEVAPAGVRVNCIAVGQGQPGDVSATVSFLVHDGDFFVGQVLCPTAGAVLA